MAGKSYVLRGRNEHHQLTHCMFFFGTSKDGHDFAGHEFLEFKDEVMLTKTNQVEFGKFMFVLFLFL